MNTHYLNATGKALETDARVNVYTIPAAEVKTEGGQIIRVEAHPIPGERAQRAAGSAGRLAAGSG